MDIGDNQPGSGPSADRPAIARRALRTGLLAAGLLVAVMVGLAATARLEIFGSGFHATLALILGIGGTIILGAGLMALSFYSARAGIDDEVRNPDDAPADRMRD